MSLPSPMADSPAQLHNVLPTAFAVNVRQFPTTQGNTPLRTLYAPLFNVRVEPHSVLGWAKVFDDKGTVTWVSMKYVQIDDPSSVIQMEWISQVDANSPGAFDCGQTCVLMLLRHYKSVSSRITVRTLTNVHAGRTGGDTLVKLAGIYGLNLNQKRVPVSDFATYVQDSVNAQLPVIALVNYNDLGLHDDQGIVFNPMARRDPGLHWVVIVGVSRDWVYIHDPLWQSSARGGMGGAYVPVEMGNLVQAYRSSIVSSSI